VQADETSNVPAFHALTAQRDVELATVFSNLLHTLFSPYEQFGDLQQQDVLSDADRAYLRRLGVEVTFWSELQELLRKLMARFSAFNAAEIREFCELFAEGDEAQRARLTQLVGVKALAMPVAKRKRTGAPLLTVLRLKESDLAVAFLRRLERTRRGLFHPRYLRPTSIAALAAFYLREGRVPTKRGLALFASGSGDDGGGGGGGGGGSGVSSPRQQLLLRRGASSSAVDSSTVASMSPTNSSASLNTESAARDPDSRSASERFGGGGDSAFASWRSATPSAQSPSASDLEEDEAAPRTPRVSDEAERLAAQLASLASDPARASLRFDAGGVPMTGDGSGTYRGRCFGRKSDASKAKKCHVTVSEEGVALRFRKGRWFERRTQQEEFAWGVPVEVQRIDDSTLQLTLRPPGDQVTVTVQPCPAALLEMFVTDCVSAASEAAEAAAPRVLAAKP
jgi:hypothetical protein